MNKASGFFLIDVIINCKIKHSHEKSKEHKIFNEEYVLLNKIYTF